MNYEKDQIIIFAFGPGCKLDFDSLWRGGDGDFGGDAQSSPEKVVETFYATFNDDPDKALLLIAPETRENERFQRAWDEISSWKFNNVETLGFEDPYVKVSFEIEYEGGTDSGTDDVEVVEVDGKWWIVQIPT